MVEQRVDRIGLPDIGDRSGSFQSMAGQVGDEGVELGLVAPDHDDMGAEPRQQPGDRAADATGAAGDDHDLTP